MKRLAIWVMLFSQTAFAEDWKNFTAFTFPDPGSYNYLGGKLSSQPVSNMFAAQIPPTCSNTVVSRFYFENASGQEIRTTAKAQTQNDGTWWFFTPTDAVAVSRVGVIVDVAAAPCKISFFERPGSQVTPPPYGSPQPRHCQKVASDLRYYYDSDIEQSTVLEQTAAPCIVFVRFFDLKHYRDFLERRRAENKNPDFETLEPEHIKVEIEHAVLACQK